MPRAEITQLAPRKPVKPELVKRPSHRQIARFIENHKDRLLFGALDKVESIQSTAERQTLVAIGKILETKYASQDWFVRLRSQAALLGLTPIIAERELKLVLTSEIKTKLKGKYHAQLEEPPKIAESNTVPWWHNNIELSLRIYSAKRKGYTEEARSDWLLMAGTLLLVIGAIGNGTTTGWTTWYILQALLPGIVNILITFGCIKDRIELKNSGEKLRESIKKEEPKPEEIVRALMDKTAREQRFLIKTLAPLFSESQECKQLVSPDTLALASLLKPKEPF